MASRSQAVTEIPTALVGTQASQKYAVQNIGLTPVSVGTAAAGRLVVGAGDAGLRIVQTVGGEAGNAITLALVDPGMDGQALAITVDGSAITATLATNGAGAITTTAALLVAALNANGDAGALMTAELLGTGADVVAAAAAARIVTPQPFLTFSAQPLEFLYPTPLAGEFVWVWHGGSLEKVAVAYEESA